MLFAVGWGHAQVGVGVKARAERDRVAALRALRPAPDWCIVFNRRTVQLFYGPYWELGHCGVVGVASLAWSRRGC